MMKRLPTTKQKKSSKHKREYPTSETKLSQYAAIVESSNDAIVGEDIHGIITSWNKAAQHLYGYTEEEVMGKSISFLFPKERKKELINVLHKIKKGEGIYHFESERLTKDGKTVYVSATISPIKDSAGKINGLSAVVRDITQQREHNRQQWFLIEATKILSSSLDYETTLQNVGKLVVPGLADWYAVDLIDRHGKVQLAALAHKNPKKITWAKQLRKLSPVDMEHDTGISLVIKTGKSQLYADITDDMLVASAKSKKELGLLRHIGFSSVMIMPLIARKQILGALTFVASEQKRHYADQDMRFAQELANRIAASIDNARLYQKAQDELAVRKQLEDELEASKSQLEIIIHNIANGITLQDATGKVIYLNQTASDMIGKVTLKQTAKMQQNGYKKYSMVDEYGNPFPLENLPGRRALKGDPQPEAVIRYKSADSEKNFWTLVKARPIFNDQGQVEMVVNIISDITEQKEAEQRKDEFIGLASHELKTPLTSLKTFTQIMEKRISKHGDKKLLYFLSRMDTQLDKLTNLITDLLDVSKMQTGKLEYKMQQFDITELLKQIVIDFQHSDVKHSIAIHGKVTRKVYGDPDRIGQVAINLLTNAIKYSPNATKVDITVKENTSQIIIGVTDFGIGIDPDEKEKIFDRFYRTKNSREGSYSGLGIGLYISSQIIKRHKGKIWVESRKGDGSTFYFTLPTK